MTPNPRPIPELRESWARAWMRIGARPAGDGTCDALLARYSEPHRKYHTLEHLGECLAWFEPVQGLAARPGEVEAALWFHDAIYDVRRSDNEERSAEWATTAAGEGGVARDVVVRIASLIMITKHTGAPAGADERLLVDIDLAILGSNKERFAGYQRQIRQEYAHVPDQQFAQRRRAILQSLLDRPWIYNTAYFHEALENAARANLRLAIDMP